MNGLTGLCNMGNTCFLNSSIQCLSNIPEFRDIFIKKNYQIFESSKEKEFVYQLTILFTEMWKENCVIKPQSFIKTFIKQIPTLGGFSQHDSHECISFILDTLDRGMKHQLLCQRDEHNNIYTFKDPLQKKAIRAWQVYYTKFSDKQFSDKLFHPDNVYAILNKSSISDIFYGIFHTRMNCPNCNSKLMSLKSENVCEL
jgi:ubiquitin C-terminal hydrolase